MRFMTKAAEKGVDYLHKELARLEKMLGGGSMSASKVSRPLHHPHGGGMVGCLHRGWPGEGR